MSDKKIIALFHGKGGVGKSNTTGNFASIWQDRDVSVFDIDRQNASRLYSQSLPNVSFYRCAAIEIPRRIPAQGSAINLVDCPPYPDIARPVLEMADLVLIPFFTEFWAYTEAGESLKEVRKIVGPNAQVRLFISRYNSSRKPAQRLKIAARRKFGDALLKSVIPDRQVFEFAAMEKKTVVDLAPASDAAKRLCALAGEVAAILNLSTT